MTTLKAILIFLFVVLYTIGSAASGFPTLTVAADGSGDYTTIQEAINNCRLFQTEKQTIFIKNGVYREKVLIDSFYTHIRLVGESVENTIITWGDHAGMPGIGTFNSYTLKIAGDGIELKNLTVENSAGQVGQAVALHVEGDRCVFRNCRFLGNQDTLYAAGQKSRQYYADCYIDGTTDFIFGAATAVFDRCTLHSKRNSFITAASTPKSKLFGYVFRNCKLTADEEIDRVFLGRPWRDYARTVFLNCYLGEHIVAEGWHNWSQPHREETAFYAEYQSTGPGANPAGRVNWSHQLSTEQAETYTLENIFRQEDLWMPDAEN